MIWVGLSELPVPGKSFALKQSVVGTKKICLKLGVLSKMLINTATKIWDPSCIFLMNFFHIYLLIMVKSLLENSFLNASELVPVEARLGNLSISLI